MQQAAPTTTANNSAFITLQNNSNLDSNSDSKWNKECIYSFKHQFSDCYYITKQKYF